MSVNIEQSMKEDDPRFKVRLLIYYSLEPLRFRADYSVNLSSGGVYLETTDVLPVDTHLFMMFKLPGSDNVIKCKSRVAWTLDLGTFKKPSLPSGMGLQFIDITKESLRAIRDFFNNNDMLPS
jgi:uncharacterized protein (TIGR02266 family)